jgi:hypothetical protein
MANNGRALESLVGEVERRLLGQGFEVKTNSKVRDEDGTQLAEFDVEIRGRVGSTDFSWLIECRDRPGSGPAPSAWVEQLYARRDRFNFNKVTAVSTTGFSEGAHRYAVEVGIELREVKDLSLESISPWLEIGEYRSIVKKATLAHAVIYAAPDATEEQKDAFAAAIETANPNGPILRKKTTGEFVTLSAAFLGMVNDQNLFDQLGVVPGNNAKKASAKVQYDPDDYFELETRVGFLRIEQIHYVGDLESTEEMIPIVGGTEYRHSPAGRPIAQIIRFAAQRVGELNVALEMQRLEETGQIQIVLRKVR